MNFVWLTACHDLHTVTWSGILKTILSLPSDCSDIAFLCVFAWKNAFPCVCQTQPSARECRKRAYFWHHVCMCQRVCANGSEHTIVYVWVWRALLLHTLTFVRKTMCFWINTLLFLASFTTDQSPYVISPTSSTCLLSGGEKAFSDIKSQKYNTDAKVKITNRLFVGEFFCSLLSPAPFVTAVLCFSVTTIILQQVIGFSDEAFR